ncbi:hypothetical protein [Archaeoglobus neptunius]|uniref:hypothetical protein n=1 Tax=Archaeoglobus neptunius TaxID=2798580 RepID=UPI0019253915|nr:hypothetical protein [Archaeoglobus neptunius]
MREHLKNALKIFLALSIILFLFWVFFILPLIIEFNNTPPNLMLVVESDSLVENVTLLFPIYTYANWSVEFSDCVGAECNISVVETEYGKMWKIWMSDVGWTEEEVKREGVGEEGAGSATVFVQPYTSNQPPIDLFSINLNPTTKYKEEVSESGRYYVRTANITIPVCVEYEGNLTEIKVKLVVQSGLYGILGIIPWSPKHDGKVYSGMREDEFLLDFKGCRNVTGFSKIDIVYQ